MSVISKWRDRSERESDKTLCNTFGQSRDPTAINFLISQLEARRDIETVLEALKPSYVYEETQRRVREVIQRIER